MSRKPDICTSQICNDYGCNYCLECSHANFKGEGKDKNGKIWRWSYNPWHGSLFLRKDGKALTNQPQKENHPAWEPFYKWLKELMK